jgi:AraC family transcriptional regulator of adaptative response / DNA-3-methyladenine glycosylase II
MLDPAICYQALRTHDERFDGRLFVGVTSTRIYCRPVCPARPPKFENCRFFASAAAAQESGFRPCLRCRPESAPDVGSWRGTANTVSRSMAAIEDGDLDGTGASVEMLAERVGVGARQLRRLFKRHLGVSPVAVAQTRRLLFAKQLIHETRLPMGEVALASGFGSVRRFNEMFHTLYARPPTALRPRRVVPLPEGSAADSGVTVRLPYRPPYDWAAMLAHLGTRAVDGVERVDGATYSRTFVHEGESGSVEVSHLPERACLSVNVRLRRVSALPSIIARLRRAFDLAADLPVITAHLARDPLLAPLCAARPGLRLPGAWDGFELGTRAILGQQVSVQAARQLAGKLVRLCGASVPKKVGDAACAHAACARGGPRGSCALTATYPGPAPVVGADLTSLPMPGARRRALVTLAEAALREPRLFHPLASVEETVARLRAIPGIGDWTAHYIALRAAREPDAFPTGDVGLLRSASSRDGVQTFTARTLGLRAERWRPFRAYAAQHLWAAEGIGARASSTSRRHEVDMKTTMKST